MRDLPGVPLVTLPIPAQGVAVFAVPLSPEHGEVPHLVTAFAHVPWLGDEFHTRKDRILVDDVEEAGKLAHIVRLAGQRGGKIEAEPVHMHLRDPVTQRVHDELQHAGVLHVERVSAPGVVCVKTRVFQGESIVGNVVYSPEAEGRPHLVSLGSVVIDDIQDHLDSRGVECPDHCLELRHLSAGNTLGCILCLRREVADGIVAPVVIQPPVAEDLVIHMLVNRQQFQRGNAELLEIVDGRGARQSGVGAPDILRQRLAELREPFDVNLVND